MNEFNCSCGIIELEIKTRPLTELLLMLKVFVLIDNPFFISQIPADLSGYLSNFDVVLFRFIKPIACPR